jgi:hypothetical protein
MKKRGLSRITCIVCACIGLIAIIVLLIFFLSGGLNISPPEKDTYLTCVNNVCTSVEGLGVNECRSEGSFCGCVDTDLEKHYSSGMNFFLQGTARNVNSSQTDRCSMDGRLVEYVCDEDENILDFEISCESLGNYTCISGKCFPDYLEFEDCRDSDGGINYLLEGKVSNGKVRLTDYCTKTGELAEIYCQQETEEILIGLFDCSILGNFACEQGACKSTI